MINLTDRFHAAYALAADLHAAHHRKGTGTPYLAHLMSVAALVLEHGGSEDEAIAALLHDTIEDQGPGYPGGVAALRAEIETLFGPEVLAIVEACTDAETIPKPPWRQRKETYIAHLATATPSALLVSSADKLHNARAILRDYRLVGEALWERFTGGKSGTLWYYRALVNAYRQNGAAGALISELDRTVQAIEDLAIGTGNEG